MPDRRALRWQIPLCLVAVWAFVLLPASAAYADNCGDLADCYSGLRSGLVVLGIFFAIAGFVLLIEAFPILGLPLLVHGFLGGVTGKDPITGRELENWERILGLLPVVGTAIREAGLGASLLRAFGELAADTRGAVRLGGEAGAIRYGALDEMSRPTGVWARITDAMLGTGTEASRGITPPGWSGNGSAFNEARGHLLGRLLGGSGRVPENIVTIEQNGANSPFMRDFEMSVARAVQGGETVEYSATPIYDGYAAAPKAITITAKGSKGFSLDVTVLNPVKAARWPPL